MKAYLMLRKNPTWLNPFYIHSTFRKVERLSGYLVSVCINAITRVLKSSRPNIGLFRGSQERGLKIFPEPYHAGTDVFRISFLKIFSRSWWLCPIGLQRFRFSISHEIYSYLENKNIANNKLSKFWRKTISKVINIFPISSEHGLDIYQLNYRSLFLTMVLSNK